MVPHEGTCVQRDVVDIQLYACDACAQVMDGLIHFLPSHIRCHVLPVQVLELGKHGGEPVKRTGSKELVHLYPQCHAPLGCLWACSSPSVFHPPSFRSSRPQSPVATCTALQVR